MSDLLQYIGNFDAAEVPPDEYELLNPGTYAAVITETEIKDGGDKVGLVVKLQIIGSQYDGRVLSDYLNIKHPIEKAVKISHRRLADYALAVGAHKLTNSASLHGKKVNLEIDVQQPKTGETYIDKYGVEKSSIAQNKIKKVLPMSGVTAQPPASVTPPTANASADSQPATNDAPPWVK